MPPSFSLARGLLSDFFSKRGDFLHGEGCQALFDGFAAERVDALLYLPAQLPADFCFLASVAVDAAEGEGAVGMLLQRLAGIARHMAVAAVVVTAAGGERPPLVGAEHGQARGAEEGFPERRMAHVAKGDGDIAAGADLPAWGNGDEVVGGAGEPAAAAEG